MKRKLRKGHKMNKIISLFTAGFIRHLMDTGSEAPSVKREPSEKNEWIAAPNQRNIGRTTVRPISKTTKDLK